MPRHSIEFDFYKQYVDTVWNDEKANLMTNKKKRFVPILSTVKELLGVFSLILLEFYSRCVFVQSHQYAPSFHMRINLHFTNLPTL